MKIDSCSFVRMSEILSGCESIAQEFGDYKYWGDNFHSLVTPEFVITRLRRQEKTPELENVLTRLGSIPTGTFVDLES